VSRAVHSTRSRRARRHESHSRHHHHAPHNTKKKKKRHTAPPSPSLPLAAPTLAALADHISALRSKLGREPRVVALLGAGASASAGLPDWRSPDSGLYGRIAERARREGDAELAACPGLVFSLSHFRRRPSAFYRAVREHCLWPGPPRAGEEGEEEEEEEDAGGGGGRDDQQQQQQGPAGGGERGGVKMQPEEAPQPQRLRPTAAHHLLAALERRGALLRAYTQNVDGLEYAAGCSDEAVVQAHGGFREAHCAACGAAASPYMVMQALGFGGGAAAAAAAAAGAGAAAAAEDGDEEEVPRCASCGERAVKPAVVLFGERLPARFHRLRLRDLPRCELLLVLGTALAVEPFASLLGAAPPACARALANRCAVREEAEEEGGGGAGEGGGGGGGGFVFVREGACRDLAVLGECDDGCLALAEAFGGAEMREEVARAWRRGSGGGGGASAAAPPPR